jgi:hypothetical protein
MPKFDWNCATSGALLLPVFREAEVWGGAAWAAWERMAVVGKKLDQPASAGA